MLRQLDEDIDDDFEEIEDEAPPPIPIPDDVIVPIGPQPGPQMMFATSEADIIVFGGAAGGGKLLALDTPIPTPAGWTTMGEIKAGDQIFAETGKICRVVIAHPIDPSPECYRLTFDDGEQIDAGAEHLWKTMTMAEISAQAHRTEEWRAARRATRPRRGKGLKPWLVERNQAKQHILLPPPMGAIRTTAEIYATLKTKRGRVNHVIELPQPLDLPPVDIPLDPYLLGAWLGDGTTASSGFTSADIEMVDAFRSAGFTVNKCKDQYGWGVQGLSTILRKIGVLGNKHVPPAYLRGSMVQRLALLQGLMDTDGCSCESGAVEFTSTNRNLADSVAEIVHSLGQKAVVCEGRATLYGRDCGPKYRVKWTSKFPAFRLQRKLARQRFGGPVTTRFRYIVDCRPIPSVPMRCITVDSPSRLYLAGKAMVPTHNTGGLLLECTRHVSVPGFSFTIFRRSTPQITNQGGLWDESYKFFPHAGGVPRNHDHSWHFPEAGAKGRFTHLEYEDTIYDYDGAQITLIGFDQLEQFTEKQFFYMLTRNRTTCGVRPYIRATANPPPMRDHWLRGLVDWWIGEDGYPIPERSGVIRYFVRRDGKISWVEKDYRDEKGIGPKSFTFIPAKLSDNPILMNADPGYAANLAAQSLVDRLRLEGGNWNAVDGGTMFQRDWFQIIDRHEVPKFMRVLRYWDRASTKATAENPNPDWTAGGLCGVDKEGVLYILDMQHFQESPAGNEKRLLETAEVDGKHRVIYLEEEGGSSGKDVVSYYQRKVLKGYIVVGDRPTGDKKTRAKPWCAMAEKGNVRIVRGAWNHNFLAEIESYPNGKKDQVDAVSGAYKFLIGKGKGTTRDLVSQAEDE